MNLFILIGINLQTAGVNSFVSLLSGVSLDFHKVIHDLFDQSVRIVTVNRNLVRLLSRFLDTGIHIVRKGILLLLFADIALIDHFLKNDLASLCILIRIDDRIVQRRILCNAGNDRRFREIQLRYIFIKIAFGSSLYAVRAGT